MEEPPKIERIVSSQGISLSDSGTILTAYLSSIDQYHQTPTSTLVKFEDDENSAAASQDEVDKSAEAPRKSRQEREEEALIAQMDQLEQKKSSAGMVSDDVYERLQMITKSICAEVEGKPLSASGVAASRKGMSKENELEGEQNDTNGADDFLAELEEAERLEKQEDLQPQQVETSKRDKKKEKKAKKAEKKSAKKAKKEKKRKSKEMESADGSHISKRVKVEK